MKQLKIVNFIGGLGNQMFQYAFYKSLEQCFENVKADISGFKNYKLHNGFELEDIFDIKINHSTNFENLKLGGGHFFIAKIWRRVCMLMNCYCLCKEPFLFDPYIFEHKKSTYYWGHWQNERYFCNISDQIRKDFIFKTQLNEKNLRIKNIIDEKKSISMHIRRGDYVNNSIHGDICNAEYYHKAINYINSMVSDATYFIFSDDIAWCKNNFEITNCHYIDWNKGKESYVDMQLMSLCNHNIIANSSFSWWGAWLNNNPQKIVVSPSKWFNGIEYDIKDIIPTKWILIE